MSPTRLPRPIALWALPLALDRLAQAGQDVRRHPTALLLVRKARQDELVEPQPPVGQQLRRHLRRVADDRRPYIHPVLLGPGPHAGRPPPPLRTEVRPLPHPLQHRPPRHPAPPPPPLP